VFYSSSGTRHVVFVPGPLLAAGAMLSCGATAGGGACCFMRAYQNAPIMQQHTPQDLRTSNACSRVGGGG
jgi:hypothetical protein